MKKLIPTVFAVGLASALLLAAPRPAAAHSVWSIGTTFSVAGLDFDLVLGSAAFGPRFGADFYFRTRRPLPIRGVACHGGCFRDRGYTYHHPACGAVGHFFGHHRLSPRVFVSYLPPLMRHRYEHYYRDHHYDRYRWDAHRYRFDRHDHWRHDSRHRYDRHRYDDRRRYDRGRYDDRHRYDRGRYDDRHRYDRGRYDDRHRYDRSRSDRHRGRRYAVPRRDDGSWRGRFDDGDSDSD